MGFDTVDELREDIRARLREAEEQRVESEFREAALDAAVEQAEVAGARGADPGQGEGDVGADAALALPPGDLARGLPEDHRTREEEILAELAPEAEQALRREAVLAAVVAAERIEPERGGAARGGGPTAEREGIEPASCSRTSALPGASRSLREDLAARQAIELIAAGAKPIPLEQAQAREKLWTPRRRRHEGTDGGLWTPER